MAELEFLITYILMIIFGSAFCLGFYIITKVEKGVEPDGSIKYYGKIFKAWGIWLSRERAPKRTYYAGEKLHQKAMEIERVYPKMRGGLIISAHESLDTRKGLHLTEEDICTIEMTARIKVQRKRFDEEDIDILAFYEESPNYVIPEIIRMPLGHCPPCMSSLWGSLIYWSWVAIQPDIFSWSARPELAMWLCWAGYCISMVTANTIFMKKTN